MLPVSALPSILFWLLYSLFLNLAFYGSYAHNHLCFALFSFYISLDSNLLKDSVIQVYNLHRSPYFWDHPYDFEPERFLVQRENDEIEGWAGFDPSRSPGALYPNEVFSQSLSLLKNVSLFNIYNKKLWP